MENNVPEGMMEFNLEKALAGWPCVTREGKEVKVLFVDELTELEDKRILCVIKDEDDWMGKWVRRNGRANDCFTDYKDIFLKKKTKTYWINIFKNNWSQGIITPQAVFKSEQEAKEYSTKHQETYLKTISFELDEEERRPKTKTGWIAILKNVDICDTKEELIKTKKYFFDIDLNDKHYHFLKIEVPVDE